MFGGLGSDPWHLLDIGRAKRRLTRKPGTDTKFPAQSAGNWMDVPGFALGDPDGASIGCHAPVGPGMPTEMPVSGIHSAGIRIHLQMAPRVCPAVCEHHPWCRVDCLVHDIGGNAPRCAEDGALRRLLCRSEEHTSELQSLR